MKPYQLSIILTLFIFPVQMLAQHRNIDFYLEHARANSPFIHKNQNEKRLVQLDMDQLKSIYSKPEITMDAGVLFAPIVSRDQKQAKFYLTAKDGDFEKYTGYDLAVTDGGQYEAVVSLRQGLFNGSKLQTYSEKADIQNRISENNIELTNHELENAVTHQYILCLKSQNQADNSLILIQEVDDQIKTMQNLVKNAVYKQSDLMLLEITRQNYQLEYETYRAEYRNNIYDLNLICGINEEGEVSLQDIKIEKKPELVNGSKFLMSYFIDSLILASDLKISELKYKPEINLFANGGMNAVYLPSVNRLGFSTGITFSMVLSDGKQREFERQKSEINRENLNFEKQKTGEQNIIQKNYTLNRIKSLDDRIVLANQQLEQYNKLLGMYKIQLDHAEISVMDFKYLIKEISAKKQETLQLEMEKQIVINTYNYWNY